MGPFPHRLSQMRGKSNQSQAPMGQITDAEMAGMDNQYLMQLIQAARTSGALGGVTEAEGNPMRGMFPQGIPPRRPPQQPPQQPPMQSPDDMMNGPPPGPTMEQMYRQLQQQTPGINPRPMGPGGPRRPMPSVTSRRG